MGKRHNIPLNYNLWLRLKIEAIHRGSTLQALLDEAIQQYLQGKEENVPDSSSGVGSVPDLDNESKQEK